MSPDRRQAPRARVRLVRTSAWTPRRGAHLAHVWRAFKPLPAAWPLYRDFPADAAGRLAALNWAREQAAARGLEVQA